MTSASRVGPVPQTFIRALPIAKFMPEKQALAVEPGSTIVGYIPMTPLRHPPPVATPGVIHVDLEEEDIEDADFSPPQSPRPLDVDAIAVEVEEPLSGTDEEQALTLTSPSSEAVETMEVATQTDDPTPAVNAMTLAATIQHRFAQLLEVGSRDKLNTLYNNL
jgi:hypothetical protein